MRTTRILFGTEFGAGNGHHVRLRAVENELRKTWPDLESRFVLPPHSLSAATANKTDTVFPKELKVLRGQGSTVSRYLAHGLCEILLNEEDALIERMRFWDSEFSSFRPDLIIADFAPSLSMAAWGKVPCFVIGNGYTLPPPELEECLVHNNIQAATGAPSEAEWLEKLNLVLQQSGAQSLDYLPQMNRGDAYGLFTIPLFDIYWQHRQQDYLGIDHPGGSPKPKDCNDGTALVYFSMSIENSRVIDGLLESQIPTIAYFGQLDTTIKDRLNGSKVRVVDHAFDLARDLPGRALAVHAGSLGMSAASVFAGVPQVGLYQHDEGMSNCRTFDIAQIGSSAWVKSVKPHQIAEMMHKAKESTSMRNYATALSHRYADFRDESSIAKVVPMARALIG
jgi:rhamnosyltransferase subunit B